MTGTTWLLVEAVVGGSSYPAPQTNSSPSIRRFTVRFDKGRVQGSDGCNSVAAAATVKAHTVTISTYTSMTLKACRHDALRSAYVRDIFGRSTSWTVVDDSLTLTTAGGDTFRYEPIPAGP